MKLRNRVVPDRPRIEVPVEEDSQEEMSSTAPQVDSQEEIGSPVSTRTRSISASDGQQQPLTPVPENTSSLARGQHAQYFQFDFNEDFILYSEYGTDDGIGEEQAASGGFLSPHRAPRYYRTIAPYPQPQPIHGASSSQVTPCAQGTATTQRQLPLTRMQLPESTQNDDTMMPRFQQDTGPWSSNSSINAEGRRRALSQEIPGITEYPRDRTWDDKMQEALTKIETTPESLESSDEEARRRLRKRRRAKNKSSMTPSKSTKNDDKRRKHGEGRDGGQGGGESVMVS